ncbi:MAG: [Fe-Fe] hydrogenase large subunit C-terminal domain-containing protein [Armatimonadota bacterium]
MSSTNLKPLPRVIDVDAEKCVNCHLCIGVCPSKYCNDASDTSKGIRVNQNLCIACGACLKACTHDARYIVDDTEQFLADLARGERITTVVAPAIDVSFPGQLGNMLAWLKSVGVEKNFDVSFGAEITTYQYLQAVKNGAKTPIISQPCPAVVSFIEIYKPSLIPHLAPTGSPTMDMASWVHHEHPGTKVAFISPCFGKKREFDDPNTDGKVTYNVTVTNLKKHMEANGIDLDAFGPVDFDGPMEAERGLLYSQPGGLFETFKRYNVPLKLHHVRRTEGPEIYEEFLEELEQEIERGECDVIVVDILNCLHGCNRGTGVIYDERTTDDVLKLQSERMDKHNEQFYSDEERRERLEKVLQAMEDIDFSRTYTDKSEWFRELADPLPAMVDVLHEEMGKVDKKDVKNCGACGYHSCEKMAKAILNGLYRPQQCHHFLETYYDAHTKVEKKNAA